MTAARLLAEIFEAPDCATEPDAYDAWCAEADAAELVDRVLAEPCTFRHEESRPAT